MGLVNTIRCDYPLPDPEHQGLEFHTNNLEYFLVRYTITIDGRLVLHARHGKHGCDQDIQWPIHGDVRIYTSKDEEWIEYVVRFTHDCVEWIKPLEEFPSPPKALRSKMDWESLSAFSKRMKQELTVERPR